MAWGRCWGIAAPSGVAITVVMKWREVVEVKDKAPLRQSSAEMSRTLLVLFVVTLFTWFICIGSNLSVFTQEADLLNANNRFLFAQHAFLQQGPIAEVEYGVAVKCRAGYTQSKRHYVGIDPYHWNNVYVQCILILLPFTPTGDRDNCIGLMVVIIIIW